MAALGCSLIAAKAKRATDGRLFAFLFLAAFGSVLGARGLSVLLHPSESFLAVEWTGFSLSGAIVGIALFPLAVMRRRSLPLLDLASPALAIGIALAKVGCWTAQCCYGTPTDVPWAVQAPADSVPKTLEFSFVTLAAPEIVVHPTPIYAILSATAAFVLALASLRASLRAGCAFLLTVAWIEAMRFVEFSYRTPDREAILWPGAFSLALACVALLLFQYLRKKGESP